MMDRSRRVVLLIDYDNLQICAARDTPGRDLQLEPVVQYAQKQGTVVFARAYAEWNLSTERLAVYKSGIEPAFAPVLRTESDRSGKSLADTVMVAEGMDMLWTLQPDVLVLATSDKDLIPLVRVAKQRGARVCVIGSDLTAVPLREMADEHISYKQLIGDGGSRPSTLGESLRRMGGRSREERNRSATPERERDRDRGDRERDRDRDRPERAAAPAPSPAPSPAPEAPAPARLAAAPESVPPTQVGAESDVPGGSRRRRRRGSRRRERFGANGELLPEGAEDGEALEGAETAADDGAAPIADEAPLQPEAIPAEDQPADAEPVLAAPVEAPGEVEGLPEVEAAATGLAANGTDAASGEPGSRPDTSVDPETGRRRTRRRTPGTGTTRRRTRGGDGGAADGGADE